VAFTDKAVMGEVGYIFDVSGGGTAALFIFTTFVIV
jgi:hypothetical protein